MFDGWKKTFLSLGGRITYIFSCLTYFKLLPIPIQDPYINNHKDREVAKKFSLIRDRGR